MSKELEALKIGIPKLKKLYENNVKKMSNNDILGFDLTFSYLDKALQRLESIDNAEPSEALECLEEVYDKIRLSQYLGVVESAKLNINYNTIKQALIKAQEQEKDIIHYKGTVENLRRDNALLKDIKNEQEKVLEIIKEKKVNVNLLIALIEYSKKMPETKPLEIYNNSYIDGMELTQDEFDLLKRWLDDKDL